MAEKERITIDTMALAGKAFNIACTLETLLVAMPEDRLEDAIPAHYMVGMLAGMARSLAEEIFEFPLVLVEEDPQRRGQ